MYIDNVDYAIEITQCYGQKNLTLCKQFPSKLTISNVVFKNFIGKTSKQYAPLIGAFACSSETVCGQISASGIQVVSPSGGKQAYCQNVDPKTLDVTCTDLYKGFN
jgi:galacturan 1,4-alpha-galacturonidase